MLLFKGPRDQFLSPLQAVCGIVEKRHTLPILSNVLIEKDAERLSLLATDIEIQIDTSLPASSPDKISLTVAARKLQDILRSLPESIDINLSFSDKRLTLKAGKSRFSLQTLPAEDFPRMALANDAATDLKLTQKQFRRLILLVQCAMANQDIRYYLNGLLVMVQGDELRVVATDSHRMAYAAEKIGGAHERLEVILPRKTVLELSRQLADNDEELNISLTQTQARFRFGQIELVSKLIDGKFPDFERVFPKGHDKLIVMSRDILLHSLQRVAILSNEKLRGVRLIFANNTLKISSSNSEQEEAQEELEIDYRGEDLDIGFNVTYLLDVLTNVGDDKIECHLADVNSSALFTLPGNESFKYVVMPMRL